MLYYSGFTRRLGGMLDKKIRPCPMLTNPDVDEGSTVTDFLPAERARGITIQSAAITFSWPPDSGKPSNTDRLSLPRSSVPHNINLIDTPGHADFTFEVLRSLRVLDGAVCILDGVAGVEAQTEKVWAQASAYSIPRIVFVNKLDRDGAAFARTVKQVGARLGVWPAVCAIPWWTADGQLRGIGDVIGLRGLLYPSGGDGKEIAVSNLTSLASVDSKFIEELKKARVALVELLSEHDDDLVEKFFEVEEDHLAITPHDLTESLRRCTLHDDQIVAPLFAGASFRNVGVQPLLDAVVDLLPSPEQRPDPEISLGQDSKGGLTDFLAGRLDPATNAQQQSKKGKAMTAKPSYSLQKLEACALAFKVVTDARRGVLVYVRVYSGDLKSNAPLYNTNLGITERSQRLLKMYANDAVDIDSIPSGQIGVIPGLKYARTGDTLISYTGVNPKVGPPAPINSLQLRPIDVPPPVFFVSVEPNSLAEEKHVKESLAMLLREDPSLHVSMDEESGQTHLAGMGELHLEIARDRLVSDLRAKARIGSIEIGYREAITGQSNETTQIFDREVGGKSSKAACTASVSPLLDSDPPPPSDDSILNFNLPDNNRLIITTSTLSATSGTPTDPEAPRIPTDLPLQTVIQAYTNGVSAALARGPTYNYPLHSTTIDLTLDPTTHIFANTTPSALSSAARTAVQTALNQTVSAGAPTTLMEPVMLVTIAVDEDSLGSVVHDVSSARGGSVVSLSSDENSQISAGARDINTSRIYAPPDPFQAISDDGTSGGDESMLAPAGQRQVVARVPLKEMVGYLKHLRSLTKGRGTFTMVVDRFERMGGQRMKLVLEAMRGEGW